jgi:O-antigen/teichoic acid export membrane protein
LGQILFCHVEIGEATLKMQNTRLNSLLDAITAALRRWFFNPWRRLSLLAISLLLGFFLGSAISTVAGQAADWDIYGAALLVALSEVVDRLYYSRIWKRQRGLWLEALNALKIGLTYSLFLEGFKLGS